MNTTPLIDIIIPNYNKAKYLKECLESVINQTYKNWKIYLIDDFSNDDSRRILNDFRSYDNIKLIFTDKNYGPHHCRNLGIEQSNSDYVAFLDSDDFWPKEKLNLQIKDMLKNDLDFTYTDISYFKDSTVKKKIELPNFYDFDNFILSSTMSTSSILLKREIISKIKFKDVMHEDYLFKCDILRENINAIKIKDTFVFYRMTKQNRSSNKFKNLINLWQINKKFNQLSFFTNIKSVLSISFNSLKNYGWK